MSKNKLIWNLVLVLVIIASLPSVYAQSIVGSKLFFIIVNTIVVAFGLFLLQALLVPEKSEKEKTSVWIIIIGASLIIGFIFGKQGFLWDTFPGFMNRFVLINAIIIAAVIYFILGLLKVNENLKTAQGQGGFIILILFFSVILASRIGPAYIWDLQNFGYLKNFLFGTNGILMPPKLFVFIGSFALLSYFLNAYVKQGEIAARGFVTYMISAVVAASLARAGVGPEFVLRLGEVVFLIVLADALKGPVDDDKFKWGLAFFIVGWMSSAITAATGYKGLIGPFIAPILIYWGLIPPLPGVEPGYVSYLMNPVWYVVLAIAAAMFFMGEGKWKKFGGGAILVWLILLLFVGGFSIGWGKWGMIGLGILALVGLVVLGFGAVGRAETRRRILTLTWGGLKKMYNSMIGSAKFLRETPAGREPQFFIENRMLFHALANYTTRSEITYRYWALPKQAAKLWDRLKDQISEFLDRDKLRSEIIMYRSGGLRNTGEVINGWNKLNLEVLGIVNRFLNTVARIQFSTEFRVKDENAYSIDYQDLTDIQTAAIRLLERINEDYNHYKKRLDAYGAHYALKASKDIIVNMANPTGDVLEHPQKFARPDAEYDIGGQGNKPDKAGIDAEGLPSDEVNQFGEVVADIVEQKDSFGSLPADPREYHRNTPRKLKNPSDIIDYPSFVQFLDNVSKDWKGLAEDIRYGLHHPQSRTHTAYLSALDRGIYYEKRDAEIPQLNPPSTEDWAIDMRALADPGKNVYWGRKYFHSDTTPISPENIPPDNPLPIFSALGLKKFLIEASLKDNIDRAKTIEFLNKYHADSAVAEKEFPTKKIGVYLGEEAARAEREERR